MLRVRLCGGLEVEHDGRVLPDALVGGRQGRLVLSYLTCERRRPVSRDELAELLWGDALPESWSSSLSAVVSRLRRLLEEAGLKASSALASAGGSYQLHLPDDVVVDVEELALSVTGAELALAEGDHEVAIGRARDAEAIAAKGFLRDEADWVDRRRDWLRSMRVRAALVRSSAHEVQGSPHRAAEAAREALALDESHEASYRRLMQALSAAGERGEALRVWERCRVTLADDLGVDPSPETEAIYLEILGSERPTSVTAPAVLPSGVVTFLFTDIVSSSALWDRHPTEMNAALTRHDELVGEVVAAHGGTLLKSKLEGDATVSVFAKATAGITAALALLDAMAAEEWPAEAAPHLRMAMHTGEAFERDGDYFGPALNRAARIRALAGADQVLLSSAVTELVLDHLPEGVDVRDLGPQELRGLSRRENVFELVRQAAARSAPPPEWDEPPFEAPPIPPALVGVGPFVGRADEVEHLAQLWERATRGDGTAVFVGGEPGVGKSRLAAEAAGRAHAGGAIVLYGQCDEDLAAPLQPFVEAMRTLGPTLGRDRLLGVRGVEVLARVVPELADLVPGTVAAAGADPDSERLALFDAVAQLLRVGSDAAPVLLVLDDLHWAGKSTLSLLRHVLRAAAGSRLLVLGTYRDTELGRTHPLAATLADLRRDGFTERLGLTGLQRDDVDDYLTAMGHGSEELGRELTEITAGNPFFVIEVLRHLEETGGTWEPGSLPEGVREATGRRLSRLSDPTNDALSVAAVVGASFDLALVEQILGEELTDQVDEARRAGLLVEEAGSPGRFRFAHALVRQVLLAELVTLKRVRLHRAIAELLEAATVGGDEDARIADLAYHWFECASAGGADHAVQACRRAADRAMERLAYEEAADLYGMALQALDGIDSADDEAAADLHLARCDALLTAGDVAGARTALDTLEHHAGGSERLAAWYTTYEGLLAVLGEPDRLNEIVRSIGAAASAMRAVGDLGGEAKAHYVHASALERLGQIGDAERALDAALAAARSAGDRRLADAILAEAPPAALWGPRPVTRASGTCLDVVRVLRVTQGAPAVEAVALSCQAVLEALRGRAEAARRMVGSALRTFDRLGLTHRRLEAELHAGFVELLDNQAVAAEELLRPAYEDLRRRGLDGEAARAAAFIGRSLLLQDRVDEADEVAVEASELAGSDLKAGIAWRDVRAEASARRGDLDLARELAEESVRMATATDALLLVADARLTLATVLETAGDREEADAEARRAIEACEAKGATAMLVRVRRGLRPPADPGADPRAERGPTRATDPPQPRPGRPGRGRLVMAVSTLLQEALNRRDFGAYEALQAPGRLVDDRRRVIGLPIAADDIEHMKVVMASSGTNTAPALLEARGELVALTRWALRGPDYEVPLLVVARSDAFGRRVEGVMFDEDDLGAARVELDAMAARADEERFDNDVVLRMIQARDALNRGDSDAIGALRAEGYRFEDRRPVVGTTWGLDGSDATDRFVVDEGGRVDCRTIATRGRSSVLQRWSSHTLRPESVGEMLIVSALDDDGRIAIGIGVDVDHLDQAVAALDETFRETEGAAHVAVVDALLADATRRSADVVHLPLISEERALVVLRSTGSDDEPWIELVSHDGIELTGAERFSIESYEDALLRYRGLDDGPPPDHPARRAHDQAPGTRGRLAMDYAARSREALDARDFDRYASLLAPWGTLIDRRPVVGVSPGDVDDLPSELEHMRVVNAGETRFDPSVLVESRGERCALNRTVFRGPSFEVPFLSAVRVDLHGRRLEAVMFDDDDLDAARAELDAMAARAEVERFDNDAVNTTRRWRDALNRADHEATRAIRIDGFSFTDRRALIGAAWDADGSDLTGHVVMGGGGTLETEVLATRGRSLALQRWVHRIPDPESVTELLVLSQVDDNGRAVAGTGFALDELDDAMAELDRLFTVTEGADHADILGVLSDDVARRHLEVVHLPLLSDERVLVVLRSARSQTEPWVDLVAHDGASITSTQRFSVEALDEALARFWGLDEHAHEQPSEPAPAGSGRPTSAERHAPGGPQGGLAMRLMTQMRDALNQGDLASYRALQAPWSRTDDRRRLVALNYDGDDSEQMPLIVDGGAVHAPPTLVEARGARVALGRWVIVGDGSEVVVLTVTRTDATGRRVETVALEEERLDEAFLELDAMDARAQAERFDNDAVRNRRRWQDAVNAGELDAVDELMADHLVVEDRRSVLRLDYEGEALDRSNALVVLEGSQIEAETIATRGRSLALSRWRTRNEAHGSESELLVLGQVDEQGRGVRVICYEPDDLDRPRAELDVLYAEGEGAAHAEAVTALLSDVARREAEVVHLPLISDDRAVVVLRPAGTDDEPWVELATHDGTRVTGTERFPLSRFDQVLVRFWDVGVLERPKLADTAATRAEARNQAAFNAHDWEGVRACYGDRYTMIDRRSVVSMSLDTEESLANQRLIFDGNGRFERETIATRGERLALSRWELTLPDEQAVVPLLTVNLLGDDGLYECTLMFDVDDLDGALGALDELHAGIAAGAGPDISQVEPFANLAWRSSLDLADACTRRDHDDLRALVADDFELVDHRLAAPTENMGEPGLGAMSGLLDLDQVRYRKEMVATRGELLVLTSDEITFVDGVAGPAQVACLTVIEVDGDGRVRCSHGFDIDALSDAYDELDRRYVALGGPDLRPYRHAWTDRDLARYGSLFAPSFLLVDRRPLGWVRLLAPVAPATTTTTRWSARIDLDAYLEYQRAAWESTPDDNLWLPHVVAFSPMASLVVGGASGEIDGGPFEGWYLTLDVLDERHRIVELYFYELDDLAEARAHFDRLTAPGSNSAWRTTLAMEAAVNAQDRAGLRDTFAPECVLEDRRLTGITTTDLGSTYEVSLSVPGSQYRHELLDTRGDRLALVRTAVTFHDRESGDVEVECLQVREVDASGRITYEVGLDVDALDEATALLDELAPPEAVSHLPSPTSDRPTDPPFANTAWRTVAAIADACTRQDAQAIRALHRPDARQLDRRHRGFVKFLDEPGIDVLLALVDLDQVDVRCEMVATRGDRLVLVRASTAFRDRDAGPAEVHYLQVTEVDEQGLAIRSISFDADALDEAYDELDHRLVAQGGPDFREIRRSYEAGDWEAHSGLYAPSFTFHDHRPLGWARFLSPNRRPADTHGSMGQLGLSAFIATMREQSALIREDRLRFDHARLHSDGTALLLSRQSGRIDDVEFELALLALEVMDPIGRIEELHFYDLDALDEARAHFDRLDSAAASPVARPTGNDRGRLAMANIRRFESMANGRDFSGWTRNVTPGRRLDDRRRVVGVPSTGDDSDQMRWLMAPGVELSHSDPVAARGERVALTRGLLTGPSFEVPFLALNRVDVAGRDDESIIFDPDDLDEALAALDDVAARADDLRYENDASTCMRLSAAALNEGDLERARSLRDDECYRFRDHRTVVRTSLGTDEVETTNRALVGSRMSLACELMATRGRSLALARWSAHVPDPEADSDLLILQSVDDAGRTVQGDGFDVDDLGSAMAALDRAHAEAEPAHAGLLAHLVADAARRHAVIVHLPLLSAEKALLVLRAEDGGDPWIELVAHDGTRVTGVERLAEADLDAALVRYWELQTD